MASKLTEIIPEQGFELVRDVIVTIVKEELDKQAVLIGSPGNEYISSEVYRERIIPFQNSESHIVNVKFANAEYDSKSIEEAHGTNTYFIDVYMSAKTEGTEDADSLANVRLHRLLGMIRAIFANPVYRLLGLPRPSITRSGVQSLNIAETEVKQDMTTTVQGRVVLSVEFSETTQLLEAITLVNATSIGKIGESEKGYKYIADI